MHPCFRSLNAMLALLLLASPLAVAAPSFAPAYDSRSVEIAAFDPLNDGTVLPFERSPNGAKAILACATLRGPGNSTACYITDISVLRTALPGSSVPLRANASVLRYAPGYLGSRAVAGDFNGDGATDLALGIHATTLPELLVFYGPFAPGQQIDGTTLNGSNGFAVRIGQPSVRQSLYGTLATFDYDGDGIQDIVFAQRQERRVLVLRGGVGTRSAVIDVGGSTLPAGIFSIAPMDSFLTQFAATGDLDHDGLADLVIPDRAAGRLVILAGGRTRTASVSVDAPTTQDGALIVPASTSHGVAIGRFVSASRKAIAFTRNGQLLALESPAPGRFPGVPSATGPADIGYLLEGVSDGLLEPVSDMTGDGIDEIALTQTTTTLTAADEGSIAHLLLSQPPGSRKYACFSGFNGSGIGIAFRHHSFTAPSAYPAERLQGIGDVDADGIGDVLHVGYGGASYLLGKRLPIILHDGFGADCG
jgi:hypothetical protein